MVSFDLDPNPDRKFTMIILTLAVTFCSTLQIFLNDNTTSGESDAGYTDKVIFQKTILVFEYLRFRARY